MYYGRSKDFESANLTIDIVNDGATSTGNVYSQPKQTGVLYNAYLIKPKLEVNDKILHFFTTSIFKSIKPKFGYENKAGWEKVKNEKIQLPVKNGEIDFDFMERFIGKIENERIKKLEKHLYENGLNNYKLTEQEQKVLNEYKNVEWKEFKLEVLFERIKTKKLPYKAKELPSESIGEHTLPCLTSSFNNQGLNYFVPKKEATILKNVISIPSNSDVYRAYFQSNEFTVLSDSYAIQWIFDNEELLPNQYLFAVQCINKVTDLPIYSYKNKLGGWNVVKNKYIQLPVKNDKPDYEIMDTLMSAIKKLIIKDVVLYVDRKTNK
jgi:hypothetical protein